jgi:hypothetical protein
VATADSSWTRTIAPNCKGAGGGACSFDELIYHLQDTEIDARWSGSPPTGVADVKSQADVDKAVTDMLKAGYPPNQRINAHNLNPARFPLKMQGALPTVSFGDLYGSIKDAIQSARRAVGDDAVRSRLDVAIYSMDNIRTVRLATNAKMMPQTLQAYIKQEESNIKVATLPDGTVDLPATLGSDPKASEDVKDKLKDIVARDWSKIVIKGGKDGRMLKSGRNHAIACGECAQFLSDLKGCAPV